MTYFFDENFPPALVRSLNELFDDELIHLFDNFPRSTLDTEWIPEVAKHGWIIITADRNIRKIPYEWEAMKTFHGRAIFIKKSIHNLLLREKVIWFIQNWERITNLRLQRGQCVEISMNGSVTEISETRSG